MAHGGVWPPSIALRPVVVVAFVVSVAVLWIITPILWGAGRRLALTHPPEVLWSGPSTGRRPHHQTNPHAASPWHDHTQLQPPNPISTANQEVLLLVARNQATSGSAGACSLTIDEASAAIALFDDSLSRIGEHTGARIATLSEVARLAGEEQLVIQGGGMAPASSPAGWTAGGGIAVVRGKWDAEQHEWSQWLDGTVAARHDSSVVVVGVQAGEAETWDAVREIGKCGPNRVLFDTEGWPETSLRASRLVGGVGESGGEDEAAESLRTGEIPHLSTPQALEVLRAYITQSSLDATARQENSGRLDKERAAALLAAWVVVTLPRSEHAWLKAEAWVAQNGVRVLSMATDDLH